MNKLVNSRKWAQQLLEDSILIPFDLALIFCITFSGEKTVSGVPIFLIFWLIIVILRRNFKLTRKEIFVQIFMGITFSPLLLQVYKYNFEYYFAAFSAILYVNALVFANDTLSRLLSDSPGAKLARWLPVILIIFLGILTLRFSGDSSRQSLIFGPNVYYRIIGVIILLQIVLFKKDYINQDKSQMWYSITSLAVTLFSLSFAFFILLKTGSRGATLVGQFVLVYFYLSVISIKRKWLKITSLAIIGFLIVFIIYTAVSSLSSDYRGLWFYDRGSSSSSIKDRQGFLENLPSFFIKDNFLFGEGSEYLYSYPHNLYVDILYNSGIFPCLIVLTLTLVYLILFLKGKVNGNWNILTIVLFLPNYIGSLVSGTLYNNYPIISMIIMIPLWVQNQVGTSSDRNKISLDVNS
ncbi:MAG: O-antigen ligase family protein [Brasilonema sp.]